MDEDGLEVEREGYAQLAGRPIPARRQWTPLGRALTVAGDNWTLLIADNESTNGYCAIAL